MVTYPLDVNLQIKDFNDNAIGQTFQEGPLTNPNNPSQKNGNPINVYYLEKPEADYYNLNVSATKQGTYDLGVYLYDKAGNIYQYDSFVVLKSGQQKTIKLAYNNSQDFYLVPASFNRFRSDLNVALKVKKIQADLYAELVAKGAIAEVQSKLNKRNDELVSLANMQNEFR